MRRIQILGIVLALSLVLVSFIALANPEGEVHKGRMGETTWFSLPDHPEMAIEALDIKESPFGRYDFLGISIFPDVMVAITDNEDVADWVDTLFGFPGFTIVVEDHELEVSWKRKKRTLFAELTVEAESVLFPGLTVEPLSVAFEGERGGERAHNKRGTETEEIPGTGYTMTASWLGWNAFVTVRLYVGTDLEFEQMTLGLVADWMKFRIASMQYELPLPIDPDDFDSPQDNIYLPIALGDTYIYEAETEDELIRNEITNTLDTKIILGVTCTVVYDVEWVDVEGIGLVLMEETDDWLAWDNYGNVWYFGEDTTEYLYDDEWNLIGTSKEGSWEAGVDGAEPGILMLANPMPGISYQQEYYEDVAEDKGMVLKLDARVSVEYGDFDDCLKTKEWTPLEPGFFEYKYYAPGVGLVFIEELNEETVKVELIDIA